MRVHPESVLFITLDSCRFDTFAAADAPALKAIAPLHKATAPGYFTYGSHSAMFVGFTPHVSHDKTPFLNPKYGKVFKLDGAGHPGSGRDAFRLTGANIIEGLAAAGYVTIGTGAVGWFNPATPTSRHLISSFDHFRYETGGAALQLAWIEQRLAEAADRPVFIFANMMETHVPYWHEGAVWSSDDNPCVPFQTVDRRADCALRQRCCVEYLDAQMKPLLDRFQDATTLLCADHGDAWGEDGLWEHGIAHPIVSTVPFLLRLRGRPI